MQGAGGVHRPFCFLGKQRPFVCWERTAGKSGIDSLSLSFLGSLLSPSAPGPSQSPRLRCKYLLTVPRAVAESPQLHSELAKAEAILPGWRKQKAGVADLTQDRLEAPAFLFPENPAAFLPSEICLSFAVRFTPSICSLISGIPLENLPVLPAQAETHGFCTLHFLPLFRSV